MRLPLVGVVLTTSALLVACGGEATPGEMTSQTYRSLEADDDLTPDEARDRGAVDDDALEQAFMAEGGAPEPADATCLYAATTYRESGRGVARFCFEGGSVVSVERNRSDLDE